MVKPSKTWMKTEGTLVDKCYLVLGLILGKYSWYIPDISGHVMGVWE